MSATTKRKRDVEVVPATPERWPDVKALFGKSGACGGCWCMWWRQSHSEFEKRKGTRNRDAMRRIVKSGATPGLIAYAGGEPVGWCSVAPRSEFPRLERSRILKPVDDKDVWSVVCFFIDRDHRAAGVSAALLRAAVEFVRDNGGTIVEGYPVEPKKDHVPEVFAFHGFVSTFRKLGFTECARRSETRPIMRRRVRPRRPGHRRRSGS
jgi:GNAT superfamily N-acetyltransferase